MKTTMRLGDIVEYGWDTLDFGRVKVIGVLESFDFSGVCIRLVTPQRFSRREQQGREGLYISNRELPQLRVIERVDALEWADVGNILDLRYVSEDVVTRRMERARALAA